VAITQVQQPGAAVGILQRAFNGDDLLEGGSGKRLLTFRRQVLEFLLASGAEGLDGSPACGTIIVGPSLD
jgi:hypothetical protein